MFQFNLVKSHTTSEKHWKSIVKIIFSFRKYLIRTELTTESISNEINNKFRRFDSELLYERKKFASFHTDWIHVGFYMS